MNSLREAIQNGLKPMFEETEHGIRKVVKHFEFTCENCLKQGGKGGVTNLSGWLANGMWQDGGTVVCENRKECPRLIEYREGKVDYVRKNSGMTPELLAKTTKNYEIHYDWQSDAVHTLALWMQKGCRDWILFAGKPGTGKTHLGSAATNHLISKGHDVAYRTWFDLMNSYRDRFSKEDYEYCKNVQVLFLDDLYKGSCSPMELKATAELINYRYVKSLQTIITTERDPEELRSIDEATAGRIVERTNHCFFVIPDDGVDRRLQEFVKSSSQSIKQYT